MAAVAAGHSVLLLGQASTSKPLRIGINLPEFKVRHAALPS
jgi:hypothetical protein